MKVSAPVLTAAQQKKSISGTSKVQKRKVLLNTLDSPLDLDWPRIGAEKEEEVKTLLTKYLSPVRANNVHTCKATFIAMPKEERAVWRKKEKEKAKEDVEESKLKMSDLLIGFRDVVRAAGKGQTCIVFCEKTPDPPLLTRLLAPLCRNNDIPLFAIKNFSAAVKNLLNIPRCLTMALKLSARETTSPLNEFYEKNMHIYQSCGLTVSQISFGASAESNADVVVQLERNEENHNRREILPVTGSSEQFYLKKSDHGCRFIPGINKNPLRTNNQMDDTSSIAADYISLGVEPSPKLPSAKLLRYPKIKQIRPNENKQHKRAVKNKNTESAPKKKKT